MSTLKYILKRILFNSVLTFSRRPFRVVDRRCLAVWFPSGCEKPNEKAGQVPPNQPKISSSKKNETNFLFFRLRGVVEQVVDHGM